MYAQQDDISSHEIIPTIEEAQTDSHERNRAIGLIIATMRQFSWFHFYISFLWSVANMKRSSSCAKYKALRT